MYYYLISVISLHFFYFQKNFDWIYSSIYEFRPNNGETECTPNMGNGIPRLKSVTWTILQNPLGSEELEFLTQLVYKDVI